VLFGVFETRLFLESEREEEGEDYGDEELRKTFLWVWINGRVYHSFCVRNKCYGVVEVLKLCVIQTK